MSHVGEVELDMSNFHKVNSDKVKVLPHSDDKSRATIFYEK